MEHTTIAVDLAKSVFQVGDFASSGPRGCGTAAVPRSISTVLRAAAAGDGPPRGVWVSTPVGSADPTIRACGAAAAAA